MLSLLLRGISVVVGGQRLRKLDSDRSPLMIYQFLRA